jgi:ParB-like chromosome segregation protein Spo0J
MIMFIRDRIKELRRVPAKLLRPNPKNWRTHNVRQRNVLQGILAEIGYADALLVRELSDGSLQLIDGHLRAETTPNQEVPVLVLDLNEAEADKLLATLDPLAALAGTDQATLDDLLTHVETENIAIQEFLRSLTDITDSFHANEKEAKEVEIPEVYQILVTCRDEEEQREVFDRLTAEGRNCRIVNL